MYNLTKSKKTIRALPGPCCYVLAGFCFFLAWVHQIIGFLFIPSAHTIISPLFMSVAGASTIAFLTLIRMNTETLYRILSIRNILIGSIVATLLGILLTDAFLSGFFLYLVAFIVGMLLSLITFAWSRLFLALSLHESLIVGIAAIPLSSILNYAAATLPLPRISILSVLCLGSTQIISYIYIQEKVHRPPICIEQLSSFSSSLKQNSFARSYARMVIGLDLMAFSFGVVAGTTAEMATAENIHELTLSANAIQLWAGCALCLVVILFHKRISLAMVITWFSPVFATILLLIIIISQGSRILLTLTYFTWVVLQVCAILLSSTISLFRVAPFFFAFPFVWGFLNAGNALGILLGQAYSNAFGTEQDHVFAMAVFLTIVVVVASSFFAGNLALSPESTTATLFANKSNKEGSIKTPLETACHQLARTHNLSPREIEVFILLAQGNTRISIAKKLFVSENTVRVHVKNIYAKLYVHSKQQLIDFVDSKAKPVDQ